ncbi:MAG: intradiol ring-cleavage dioxygenase [Saprospiraceae bacterium]|nr:intradiol ring-cleavage dioxygenase [Saprospiraceae bacterium]
MSSCKKIFISLRKAMNFCWMVVFVFACNAQNHQLKKEDITADQLAFNRDIPGNLTNIDTSLGWKQVGQKLLLTGTAYQIDGKTPAPNVIIYYEHAGKTTNKNDLSSHNNRQIHGSVRGWVQTANDGKFFIYTTRPEHGPTPGDPAEINITVKEPDIENAYDLDDFVFDDDKLLTGIIRKHRDNRGGSGVLRLVEQNGLYVGERNIILGLNIPNYPKQKNHRVFSGKKIGEEVISFTPFHAWGPDKGSKTCPVCKYGWYLGILYFVGNHPDWQEIEQWLIFLEAESVKREKYLKVYFVYGNESSDDQEQKTRHLEELGNKVALQKVALTFVPSFSDKTSEINLNLVNPEVDNTFLIYKRSTVVENLVDLKPSVQNFALISQRLDDAINEYFDLPRLKYGED